MNHTNCTNKTTQTTPAAQPRLERSVEEMLHEIAYVMKLAGMVSNEIRREAVVPDRIVVRSQRTPVGV